MPEETDVKSHLVKCKVEDNVQAALDLLFVQQVLPYNPYRSLLSSFLCYSEQYVMRKSHLNSGNYLHFQCLV